MSLWVVLSFSFWPAWAGAGAGKPLVTPEAPALLVAETPSVVAPGERPLIIPAAPDLSAPQDLIVLAAGAIPPELANPSRLPEAEELRRLADALSPGRGAGGPETGRGLEGPLAAGFDGLRPPTPRDLEVALAVPSFFQSGPQAPSLERLETVGRQLFARLLPDFYKPLPIDIAITRPASDQRQSATYQLRDGRHRIELHSKPVDAQGNVESGAQLKIDRLLDFVHEFCHALFGEATSAPSLHPPSSSFDALTEGFAVTLELAFVDRLLRVAAWAKLSPRDAADLDQWSRRFAGWLQSSDTRYSEGALAIGRLHRDGGDRGLTAFLSRLRAERLLAVSRADPAYQLALGQPELLAAFLAGDRDDPLRLGTEAFGRAARGEVLAEEERRLAKAALRKTGPEDWRRVWERALDGAAALLADPANEPTSRLWRRTAAVRAPFVLAALDERAAAGLTDYLLQLLRQPGGPARLFGEPGATRRFLALSSLSTALPWSPPAKEEWDAALRRWIGLTAG